MRHFFSVAILRGLSSFLGLFVTLIITNFLEKEAAGSLLYLLSLMVVVPTFLRLGMDNAILKRFSVGGFSSFNVIVFISSMIFVVCFWAVFSIIFYPFYIYFPQYFPDFFSYLFFLVSCLLLSLVILGSYAFQGRGCFFYSIIFQGGLVSFIFILFFSLSAFFYEVNFFVSLFVYFLSVFFTFVFFSVAFLCQLENIPSYKLFSGINAGYLNECSSFWASSLMFVFIQWSPLLISGFFLSPSDLANLSVALRCSILVSFFLLVANTVVSRKIAALWSSGNILDMSLLVKRTTRTLIVVVFPIYLTIFFFNDYILGFFGESYSDLGLILILICTGQLINVATGPVGYLLNMTGHEGVYTKLTFFSGALSCLVGILLVFWFGLLGAAISSLISLSLQNIIAFFFVKKIHGFYTV